MLWKLQAAQCSPMWLLRNLIWWQWHVCLSQTRWPQGVHGNVGWNLQIMVEDCEKFKGAPGGRMLWDTWLSQVLGVLYQTQCFLQKKVMASTKFWGTWSILEKVQVTYTCPNKGIHGKLVMGDYGRWMSIPGSPVGCEWPLLSSRPLQFTVVTVLWVPWLGKDLLSETTAFFLLRFPALPECARVPLFVLAVLSELWAFFFFFVFSFVVSFDLAPNLKFEVNKTQW